MSVPLTDDEAPVAYGDGLLERLADEDEPTFLEMLGGLDGVAVEEFTGSVDSAGDGATDLRLGGSGAADPAAVRETDAFVAAQPGAARRSRRPAGKREPVGA